MGFPSPAKDYHENRIDLNELLIAHPAATFPMKTDTDAMIGDGILKGSLVLVDRSLQVKSGMIIVAVHEGELIMRRLEIQGFNKQLIASNEKYKPIKIETELNVWGVVSVVIYNPNNVNCVRFS